MNGFASGLALIERLKAARKWAIPRGIWRGRDFKANTPPGEEMDIFWNNTMYAIYQRWVKYLSFIFE